MGTAHTWPGGKRQGSERRNGHDGRRLALASLLVSLVALAACSSAPQVKHSRVPSVPAASAGAAQGAPATHLLSPDAAAARIVGTMSLDEKLGQLIVVQFTDTTYTPQQAAMIGPFRPGGVMLYGYAMGTAQQLRGLLAGAQSDSPIPMLTLTDLEGGVVDRLAPYVGAQLSG